MSGLTLENIRIIIKELLDGYARIQENRILETSPATTEDEEGSEYSIEDEEETHVSKLKRVEERLHELEAQVSRIAIMQEKSMQRKNHLATF